MTKHKNIPTHGLSISWWGFIIIFGLFLIPVGELVAGVLVAPSVVVMSDKNRTGRMTLQNPTDAPKEVTISFSWGIPESDSLGNVNIYLQDTAITDPNSALGWVRAFPRKLIIPANGSQVVRFVADPPGNLKPGEYWARIVVESHEGVTEVPSAGEGEQITTQLNMVMRTAIVLKYRNGDDLVASIDMTNPRVIKRDSMIEVYADFINRGNVSYIGVYAARLLDADGKEISANSLLLAVYRDLTRKLLLQIKEGEFKGPYQVEVSVTSKGRKDIPPEEMIFGNEIVRTVALSN